MTSRDFCFWLQGYLEISLADKDLPNFALDQDQLNCVQNHLNLVFKHEIDPSMGDEEAQAELNNLHNPNDEKIMRC